jgi:hypothetical protein
MSYWDKLNQFEEKAVKWRKYFISRLTPYGFELFDPTVNFSIDKTFPGSVSVAQNDVFINASHAGIANTEAIEESPGSIYELTRFKDLHKPVFAFGERVIQPHINSCITEYFKNEDELIDFLVVMFCQKDYLRSV